MKAEKPVVGQSQKPKRQAVREIDDTKYAARVQAFREWVASMPNGNVNADLSRDSVYERFCGSDESVVN